MDAPTLATQDARGNTASGMLIDRQSSVPPVINDDAVLILVSGHGTYDLSKDATYYYGTYNIDIKNLATTAVSFDEIESLLRGIAPACICPPRSTTFHGIVPPS